MSDSSAFVDSTVEIEEDVADSHSTAIQPPVSIELVKQYAWVLLALLFITYALMRRYLSKSTHSRANPTLDSSSAIRRLEALEKVRARQQEALNEDVRKFRLKKQEQEELNAQKRMTNWEAMKAGKSTLSDTSNRSEEDNIADEKRSCQPRKPIRSGFNPLMGDGGTPRFRPSSRSVFGGG